ncbi:response regulator [Tenacibaculum jejuense]|uniref:Putative Two-component system response regulatory protein, LuxR family n=1 Tax=Tenacibaculum jejuense TaxID=584609 RepID=A0A238U6C1_9FLAO|nr:response regulator transcription factor [Tenacibaculum jejuense]SNR14546.1 putative Two-component system response regulatory protein, LuxR family [Tenacibaculum jejuense]
MKVFITDDHELIIDGIQAVLKTSVHQVVGSAKTGSELLHWLDHNECDVVILDLKLPDMSGLEVLKKVFGRENAPKFLIVSGSYDAKQIQETILLGASGYLSKVELSKELDEALLKLSQGKRFYTDSVIDVIISRQLEQDNLITLQSILSPREAQALQMLTDNMETCDICDEMRITKSSFNTLISRMTKKLKVKRKIGLVVLAIKHKFNVG